MVQGERKNKRLIQIRKGDKKNKERENAQKEKINNPNQKRQKEKR